MMSNPLTSIWKYLPGAKTNMSKDGSDEAPNPTKSENKQGKRETSCDDDASGGKDRTLDNQGLSRSTDQQEEYMLHETASTMIITRPESSYTRGRQASGQSYAKDPLVTSNKRGQVQQDHKYSEAVMGRSQKELYGKTKKEDVKLDTKNELAAPAEPNDLRKRLEESEKQKIQLLMELDYERRGNKNLENKAAEMDLLQKESRRKSKAIDGAMKEIEFLTNELDKAWRQIKDLRSELEATHRQLNEIAIHHKRQDAELQTVRQQLKCAESAHQGACKQLMERTTELQSAQMFMDVADSLSCADIINMTAELNAEILQSAALIADSLEYDKGQREAQKEMLEEDVGEILAQALIDQISVNGEDVDPTLVQLALQVCLVRCSEAIITSWTLSGNDECLSAIYSRIWSEKKQSVAGRWRSMTQMHAAIVDGQNRTLQMIILAVERVLMASTNGHHLINQFQKRLSTINNLCLQLRSSIGQHITSLEIRPFMVEPGLPFDPNQMDDTYAKERKTDSKIVEVDERVAGSTELGLISHVKDTKGKVDTRIMLKPKVVFFSALTKDG